MSASDAAPLPRLGEVFFDVRGNSRSMRLSWYADTDVAVFSIWQGGKCTGTFRLPMDDLSRMIEILQRGPEGRARRRASERRPSEGGPSERRHNDYGAGNRGIGIAYDADRHGGYEGDSTVVHNPGGRPSAASAADYGADEYGAGQLGGRDLDSREFSPPGHRAGDYGADDYGASDYGSGEYRSGEYRSGDRYEPADYGPPGGVPAEYASQSRSARHQPEHYESADYGRPEQEAEWWSDADNYQGDRTGQRFVPPDDAGYGQQRFAPPYARPRPDSSEAGFMDDSEYRLPADPAGRSRHSAGRHSSDQGQ